MSDGASHGYRESHPLPVPDRTADIEARRIRALMREPTMEELRQMVYDLRQKNAHLQERLREDRDDWRDEVAARIAPGLVPDGWKADQMATLAYDYADALLAEGKRRREGEGRL